MSQRKLAEFCFLGFKAIGLGIFDRLEGLLLRCFGIGHLCSIWSLTLFPVSYFKCFLERQVVHLGSLGYSFFLCWSDLSQALGLEAGKFTGPSE